jgi:hypothetical protein
MKRRTTPAPAPDGGPATEGTSGGMAEHADYGAPATGSRWTLLTWALLLAAMGLVLFVRLQGVSLDGLERRAEREAAASGAAASGVLSELTSAYTFEASDGRRFRYPQEMDSYFWMRVARHSLATGSPCDEVVDGVCRDTFAHAPVGREQVYGRTLHVVALAWTHRLLTWFDPVLPLMATAPWLSILLCVAGVLPAFAIAKRLAGDVAGFVAGPLAMLHIDLLWRSSGADNDIWHIVLPLFAAWMAVEASATLSRTRRLSLAAMAGLFLGLHAAIWSGWLLGFAVLAVALGGHAMLVGTALLVARQRGDDERATRLATAASRAATVLGVFLVATFASVAVLDSPQSAIGVPASLGNQILGLLQAVPAAGSEPPLVFRPDPFSTVTELMKTPGTGADAVGGALLYFLAWFGVLLLLVPPNRIEIWHLGLVVGANLLFRQVWGAADLSAISFALLLFGPLAIVLLAIALLDRRSDEYLNAAIVLVIVWFLASAVLSREAMRFQMFLAPPFAIAAGVFFGRVCGWLRALVQPWLIDTLGGPTPRRPNPRVEAMRERRRRQIVAGVIAARFVVFAGACAAIAGPVVSGVGLLRDALPMIHSGWVSALEEIRRATPPGTIVHTSWDTGYWAQFFAERPTTGDGGSLSTDVPYWTARALMAPADAETAGILRMLECGSAVRSGAEAERSAANRLVRAGIHPTLAPGFLARLVSVPPDEAHQLLQKESIAGEEARRVLEASHCEAPPSVVVTSSRLLGPNGWRYLGNWDFRRAFVTQRSSRLPTDEALAELTRDLGYESAEARRLLAEVAGFGPGRAPASFFTDLGGWVTEEWVPCRPSTAAGGASWQCPVAGRGPGRESPVESVTWTAGAGEPVTDVVVRMGSGPEGVRPRVVVVADRGLLRKVDGGASPSAAAGAGRDLAVLVDAEGARVLVGSPSAISSGFTRLHFLDERYSPSFRRLFERRGPRDERVVVWQRRDG